jgi:hypothetical protein
MKLIWFPIIAALFSYNVSAHGVKYLHAPQHQHGVGDISIAWHNTKTGIQLTTTVVYSGEDVVKFEHLPKNAKEKRQVRDVYQQFIAQPVITAQGCQPIKVTVSSALFAEHNTQDEEEHSTNFISNLLGESPTKISDKQNNTNVPKHMDFAATYHFNCDTSNKVLAFQHFSSFPHLQTIRVHQDNLENKVTQTLTLKALQIQMVQ